MANPCPTHTFTVHRVVALEDLNPRNGFPIGTYHVTEESRCACWAYATRRVPGIRARSPKAAMAAYRDMHPEVTA